MISNKSLFCVLIPIILCLSIFPIIELYFGIKYKDTFLCDTTININLSTWLIVKGSVSIFSTILIFLTILSDKNSLIYCIFSALVILYKIFLIIWLIIGSIIFWKDCTNLEENDLNIFMYFSLILGFLSFLHPNSNLVE
jgi:hypothetical protein